jgi:hypothetical protein
MQIEIRILPDRSPFEVEGIQTPGNDQMLANLNHTGGETLLHEFLKQVVGVNFNFNTQASV